jgi:hypothetical protein
MIPKRKPAPANRKARRAAGLNAVKPKSKPGGPRGPSGVALADRLSRVVAANDASVTRSDGLMMGEKGAVFHRAKDGAAVFAYAVTVGKNRVTLHAMPMYCEPKIHAAYKKRIKTGHFGKGCIRFKPAAEVDLDVIAAFVRDCARVPLGG